MHGFMIRLNGHIVRCNRSANSRSAQKVGGVLQWEMIGSKGGYKSVTNLGGLAARLVVQAQRKALLESATAKTVVRTDI